MPLFPHTQPGQSEGGCVVPEGGWQGLEHPGAGPWGQQWLSQPAWAEQGKAGAVEITWRAWERAWVLPGPVRGRRADVAEGNGHD